MAKRVIDEQALFDTALEEFSQQRFDDASINKIISSSGIAKGSFYYRFSNKYELYVYLLKESNRRKWQYINSEAKTDTIPELSEDIFDFFLIQAEIGVRFAIANPMYHQLSKMFSKEKGSALYERVLRDLEVSDESGISRLIEESYKAGNFKDGFSLDFIKKLLKSLFFSFDEILFKNEEYELEKAMEYLSEFVEFIKHGLKA